MNYKERQRKHQICLVEKKEIFQNAEADAMYCGKPRPYIL